MRYLSTIGLMAAVAIIPVGAEVLNGVWKVGKTIPLRAPLMVDSTAVTGKKYDISVLLNSPLDLRQNREAGVLNADTVINLTRPAQDATLQLLSTRLRADAYTPGTLKVSCPSPFILYVDGKEVGKNESANPTGSASAALNLEPERDYAVAVKILSCATDTVTPSIKAEWTPTDTKKSVPVRLDASMKRRLMLDDTEMGTRISYVSVSPDGNYLLYYISTRTDGDKSATGHYELRDLRKYDCPAVVMPDGVRWMPTTTRLWTAEEGENGYDIQIIDPATMARTTVARGVPDSDIIWNVPEDKIYYFAADELPKQSGPLKRLTSMGARVPGAADGRHLMEFDPATSLARPLTYGQSTYIEDLARDGRHMLLMTTQETNTRPFVANTLVELDTYTLKADTIVPPTGFVSDATYSPDEKQLLILGSAALFDGIGANIGDNKIPNDFDVQAFIMDRATGKVTPISRDFNPNIKNAVWNHNDGQIYFLTEDGFDQKVYAYNPVKKTYTKLPLMQDLVSSFSMGENGKKLAYRGGNADHAGSAYVYDVKAGTNSLIADPLGERLSDIDMGHYKQWTFTASDGTPIDGYLYYPPEFDASKKYPMIVYYYGGTSPSTKGITNPYSPQLFASRGYVVYVINPSGATGYGQEFAARHVNAWGKRTADDIIEGVTKITEEHPFINKDKIGCLGASYGGFMTQYLQTQTPLFAAAVSHAGISNVTSYWGEGYWGYSYNGVAAADSYPWTDPELFTKQGSLFNADKIHTPLLLLHGTADTNVPIGESIQLYNALKILGREVEFVTVDGENHFIATYPKRQQWHNTIMAWFARWLQDDPSWWNALYK